jgi:hypothetical protein
MIYFAFGAYDQEAVTGFAASHHDRDRITIGFDRFFVHAFSCSRIKQHSDSQSNSYNNRFC